MIHPSNDATRDAQEAPGADTALDETLAGLTDLAPADRARVAAAVARARADAERRVQESEERLGLVLEAGRMGTWEWDLASGRQHWSPELEGLLGFPPGGGPRTVEAFYALVHPEDLPSILAAAERASAEGWEYLEDEFRVVRPDGRTVWLASRSRLYRDGRGRVTRMVGVNADVTRRKQADQALRQSKESLDLALAATAMVTWDWDIVNDSYTWDATQYAIFGVSPDSFTISLDAIWAATHPDDRASLQALAARSLATGEPYRLEFRILRPTGEVRWCVGGASATLDHHGRPVRMSGITYDITDRRHAEEELRDSQHFLQRLTTTVPTVIYVYDLTTNRNVYANRQLADILGYTPEEIQTMGEAFLPTVIHPDDWAATPPHMARLLGLDDGAVIEREYRMRPRAGGWRWFFGREMIFARGADGQPCQVLGSILDITERKQAEEALREAQARRLDEQQEHAARLQRLNAASLAINAAATRDEVLRLITEQARDLIGAHQAVTSITVNQNWAQAISATSLSDKYAAWRDYDAQPDGSGIYALVCRTNQPMRLTQAELEAHPAWHSFGAEGDRHPPIRGWLAVPLVGRDGRNLGLIQLSDKAEGEFDEADEALLQQLAQLAALALEKQTLYEQEQAARAQAEEASRVKDEFLATVSHELRTPLTAFLGYAQMLQIRKRDEAYVARTVDKMVRSAQTQAQIIEDLLDVSQIVSGRLRIDPQRTDLIPVVRAALDTVRPAVEAKGLRVQVELDPAAGPIVGDANRLQQVAWNLLANAAKFTPAGGTIMVRLRPRGAQAELTVSDTGKGISPDFLPYVFDRFRQADGTSHRAHGGLGLGLAIVRHLVELHGGSVRAASDGDGRGATFTVSLPLAGAEPPGASTVAEDLLASGCPPELAGLRVLLVDDQPDIVELLQELLSPCGAVVQTSGSAPEALELVRAWRPDVLVSDIAMPGEDGYWLIERVRDLPPGQGGLTPAVALTAYVRMEDRVRVLGAGFQLYVPKPVEAAALRSAIARLAHADEDG